MSENGDDNDGWENTLLGKSTPDKSSRVEQKAHNVRQVALWQSVQDSKELTSAHQAHVFYRHVSILNKRRKQSRLMVAFIALTVLVVLPILAFNLLSDEKNSVLAKNRSIAQKLNLTGNNANHEFPYMVEIPEGVFTMGCEAGWDDVLGGCTAREKKSHEVHVKKFAMSKYETTVGQFRKFVEETNYLTTAEASNDAGCTIEDEHVDWALSKAHNWRNPGFDQSNQNPVVCISWDDTQAYTQWLSQKTGIKYRLPTEEEWEYAARGEGITAFYWGSEPDHNAANYRGIGGRDVWEKATAPVGTLSGNVWGLHDVSGNVWEWVENCWRPNYQSDCHDTSIKTRRGGSWFDPPRNIRLSYRSKDPRAARSILYGFRVAHDL